MRIDAARLDEIESGVRKHGILSFDVVLELIADLREARAGDPSPEIAKWLRDLASRPDTWSESDLELFECIAGDIEDGSWRSE